MSVALTRAQVRALDRRATDEFGIPSCLLMENAGRGAAECLLRFGISGPVLICAGKGNNGGDGLVVARHLDYHGVDCRVVLFTAPEELTGDAALNYRIVKRSGIPVEPVLPMSAHASDLSAKLAAADWIVDALLGTGLSGNVRAPYDGYIEAINAFGKKVLAIDIPSGLDCDTGQPLGVAVRARHTVTFVAPKQGFKAPGAAAWLGQVHVAEIGVPRRLVQDYIGSP